MLVTLKEILEIAEEKKIAVGAFNTPNLESLIAILDAAEELQLPVKRNEMGTLDIADIDAVSDIMYHFTEEV